jgi:hypothetical protein
MEWKIKEESSVNLVFSVYSEESNKLLNNSMSPTWDKIMSSWDIPGYGSSIRRLTGKKDNSLGTK